MQLFPRANLSRLGTDGSARGDSMKFLQRFASIRWKLTAAFMVVSLLLVLTMAAIFLGGLIFILNAPLLPTATAESARDLAGLVEDELAAPQGNIEQLIDRLHRLSSSHSIPEREGDTTVELQDDLLIVLLDREGRVIHSTRPLDLPKAQPLAALEPEPVGALVALVLAGERDPSQLGAWSQPDHHPIGVAPVFDANGELAGVLYLRLLDFPQLDVFLGALTPFVISFAIPWLIVSTGMALIYSWLVGRGFARRIARLTEASIDLSDGDLSKRIEDPSNDELGQLGRQFNAMADQLSTNLRSLRMLAERNAQLAEQAALLAAVEERNRLARELHDSVSQELFSLTLLAAAAQRTLANQPIVTATRLQEIEESARRALEETRNLIFALRPAVLDGRGLAPALRDLTAALGERQGLMIGLKIVGERHIPLEHEQALFRIVQEALANISRHSGVRAAMVTLHYHETGVTLEVCDEGRGFAPQVRRDPRAFGLQSMSERASALGGTFTLTSAPGAGTKIVVALPIADSR
ncbi:MAG: sensor histidine kinase [Candidatus Viridilinea halotolerans]|uniref:histidine kinase n=1 Tax=Candidatus Viridilinea halotolerans TaxID=2491704 RepID=A0A426TTJ3_9CHLR|nr:MAG: sensor histidine kinase [Candidatus Viridilinea halotolerans]